MFDPKMIISIVLTRLSNRTVHRNEEKCIPPKKKQKKIAHPTPGFRS